MWGISRLTPLYPTNGLLYAPGSQSIVVGGKAARNAWHGCHGRHLEGRHLGSNFGILNGKMAAVACDMSFNTSLISEEQWWSPFPPTLSCWEVIVSERWKIFHILDTITSQQDNIGGNGLHHCSSEIKLVLNDISHAPPSHLKFQSWIQYGGPGTHVTHFVQLYPQPLYTASQVSTTSRSWDKGVLTDLCLTLYIPSWCGQGNFNSIFTKAKSIHCTVLHVRYHHQNPTDPCYTLRIPANNKVQW